MIVDKYPANFGHTTVIDNLAESLVSLGYMVGIGAFNFSDEPPNGIEKIKLNRLELLFKGTSKLKFDVFHIHQPRMIYYFLRLKKESKLFLHYHGISNWIQKKNMKMALSLGQKKISCVISVSKYGKKIFEQFNYNIPIRIVENGIKANWGNNKHALKNKQLKLLFVGGLYKHKNVLELVSIMPKILEKFPHANLDIVGSGKEKEKIKNLISKLGLKNKVKLLGKIEHEKISLNYESSDVYISTSKLETYPIPPIEAMGFGKPVLLSDIEPHQNIVNDSKGGFVFRNINEIVPKLEEIILQKNILKINAKKYANEHSWKTITKKIIEIYDSF